MLKKILHFILYKQIKFFYIVKMSRIIATQRKLLAFKEDDNLFCLKNNTKQDGQFRNLGTICYFFYKKMHKIRKSF